MASGVGAVLADDCDNWGRLVHVGQQQGDDFCYARAGVSASVTKRLEDKFDYDYFLLYLGYNDESAIGETYRVTLTNTRLTRPQIVVGTFYDEAPTGNADESAANWWYDAFSGDLGGMSEEEFVRMVSFSRNLAHDGVYDYVDGEVVVVQESSDHATREMFYAVPVGTAVGRNDEGEMSATFEPPDRGAYMIIISNYGVTRRRGRLTGSYTVNVTKD